MVSRIPGFLLCTQISVKIVSGRYTVSSQGHNIPKNFEQAFCVICHQTWERP